MTASACPDCGADVPDAGEWVSWCERCGWNAVGSAQRGQARGGVERFLETAGRTLGERLAAELRERETLTRTLTPAIAVAYAIAAAIELTAIGVVAGAIALAVLAFPNPFAIVGALVMLLFAWLIRPRLGRVPTEGVVSAGAAPTLHALAAEVAAVLETNGPYAIVVDDRTNASWSSVGIRRRAVMKIGLPLFEMLAPQERVALIAHEIAHDRNGDLRRGLIVGSALGTLRELYVVLLPGVSHLTYSDLGVFDVFGRALLWLLAQPVKALYLLELHLLLRDMQRAEYLADALAARVAGTDAVAALHEALLLIPLMELTLQHATRERLAPDALFPQMRAELDRVPERERRRRLRAAELEGARLGDTHPPTAMRIDLLRGRPRVGARLALTDQRSAAIDAELASVRRSIAQRLIDRQRDSLYR